MLTGAGSGEVNIPGAAPRTTGRCRPKPAHRDVLDEAHAFWLRGPGRGEIRPVTLPEPGSGDVVVRTLRSGVSRGTETLVFRGGVPPSQYEAMRAPFQEGDFPGPVKYGYLNVGAVEQGPPELRGRTVFCLYPHQTAYVVPAGAVTVVPDDMPPERAVLAGTVETAVNALWDAAPLVGDRVAVVGAGMVGCCVARLLARFPGVEVTLVDVDVSRAEVAAALGAGLRAAGRRRRRMRPGRAYERDVRRAPALARPARARGHGDRPQLVRRRGGPALAGRRVPRRPPRAAGQPGRDRVPGPERAPHDGRPAGPRARPAARPRLRRDRRPGSRASTRCPASWRAWPRGACRRSATPSPTTGRSACSA